MVRHLFVVLFLLALIYQSESSASEQSTYDFSWLDQDKEVYVLQNRRYRKAGKTHLNVGGGITVSGAFVDSKTIQGRIGHFIWEDWGFELIYAKNSGSENTTAKSVRNTGAGSGTIPFRRIVDGYMGGFVLWSPFYTKINTFNQIIYMDWILGLGYGQVEETNNREELMQMVPHSPKTETHNALMWELGMQFYLNEYFNIRTDLTVMHYKAKKGSAVETAEETWYDNYDLSVALGFNF